MLFGYVAAVVAGQIRDALRVVIDPELGVNIVDFRFVCGVSVEDGAAWIGMTAATPVVPPPGF